MEKQKLPGDFEFKTYKKETEGEFYTLDYTGQSELWASSYSVKTNTNQDIINTAERMYNKKSEELSKEAHDLLDRYNKTDKKEKAVEWVRNLSDDLDKMDKDVEILKDNLNKD